MSRRKPSQSPLTPPPAGRAPAWAPALIVLLAAVALCAPMLLHGPLASGSDVYATAHYIQGFSKAFGEGDLLPRWTDRTNQGLGAPSFVMFPPLFFYAATAGKALAGSVVGGVKIVLVLLAILTGLSFYLLAREWAGPGIPAAAGAAAYLLLPYHTLDVYQRCAMSETTAFLFFPLILLFARRSLEGGGAGSFIGLALSYAGLIATHLVSSFMFSLGFAIWLLWEARGRYASLWRVLLALACGAGLAAPFLLPAALEKSYVNISWVKEMPNGDFHINFIFKDDPLPVLGFKDPVKPPVLKSAHSQLILAGLAAWIALALSPRDERRRRTDAAILAALCAMAYLIQTEISSPVWSTVPELATIQFPWRFQCAMVLTASLLVSLALAAMARRAPGAAPAPPARKVGAPLLAAAGALNLLLAFQNTALKPFTFTEEGLEDPAVASWIEPALTPREFREYSTFRQRRVSVEKAALAEGRGDVRIVEWVSSRRVLDVTTEAGGRVEVGTFWFPGWTGTLDGAPLAIRPAPPYATITFEVPPGRHAVVLRFANTPLRSASLWIAAAFLPLTGILAWTPPLRSPAGARERPGPPRSRDRG